MSELSDYWDDSSIQFTERCWSVGPQSVDCPKCGAPSGWRCRVTTKRPDGRRPTTDTHMARYERFYG